MANLTCLMSLKIISWSVLKDNSIEKPGLLLETPPKKLKDDFLQAQKIYIKSENILREPSILEEYPINSSACSDQPIVTYKL